MKALKVVLIATGGLLVLLLLAVVVLSIPAVQRALVVRFASDDEQQLNLEYVHAGPRKVEMRGLDLTRDGGVYQASEVTAEISFTDLLFRRKLELGDVRANGLVIDLSAYQPEEASEEEETVEGVLEQLELPILFSLKSIQADGQLILPEMERESPVIDFQMDGGGFAPDGEGNLRLVGELSNFGPLPGFSPLHLEGDLSLRQTASGAIDQARLLALVSVPGNSTDSQETLAADILLLAIEDGEEYQARISRVQAPNDSTDLSTLIVVDAIYQREDGVIAGRWELQVDEEQFAAFIGETELPPFAANGSGEFSYGLEGEVAAAGELALEMESLGAFLPQLEELGRVAFRSRFDLAMAGSAVSLSEINLTLEQQQEAVLEIRNFEPIVYDLESGQLEGVEGQRDLAEVIVRALPVEWANLFLVAEEGEPETVVEGGAFAGRLLIQSDGAAISFQFTEPLQADGISVVSGETVLLSDVALLVDGSGRIEDEEFEGRVGPIELTSQGDVLFNGTANVDSAEAAEANFQANLPLLLNLPLLQEYNNLASGNAQLVATLSAEEPRELRAAISANGLVTEDEQQTLPDLEIEAVLREISENGWSVEAPLTLSGPQPSDLTLRGEIVTGEIIRFDLALTGEQFYVDQILALASGFSTEETEEPAQPETAPAPPPPGPGDRDEEPFWSAAQGTVTLNIARVYFESDYEFENVSGELSLQPEIASTSLVAEFLDEPMTVDANVRFLAAEEEPYRMEGMVDAPNLPVGALFRQFQPNRPPTLEGLFAASVEIEGSGGNLEELIDQTRGRVSMRSGGGIIRLLYSENPLAGLGFAATTILSQLGGEVGAISSVASRLGNMSYSEISLEAQRDQQLNLIVENFAVVAPELHLQGNGAVRYREDVPILEQPMELRFQMGVQGALQETLDSLRVLANEPDAAGYVPLRNEFVITGTPADPNTNAFYGMLASTVLRFIEPDREEQPEERERPRIPRIPDIFDIFGGGTDRGS